MKLRRVKLQNLEIFKERGGVAIAVCTREEAAAAFKRESIFREPHVAGATIVKDGFHPLVWVDSSKPMRYRQRILAHEAIHATLYAMKRMAMDPYDDSGQEFLCYSVETILKHTNLCPQPSPAASKTRGRPRRRQKTSSTRS